ncbi:hypothetical protein E3P94_03097 [Wallemia ichthyophaga]|nr:hypothetical protein E3P95_03137 [Wallemia ichthyophaga]TIA97967.1 hypothetical protein E3P94_03097 [Wallemia ichthyophaga]
MRSEIDYSVYLVTARDLLPVGKHYLESLEESLQGGVTVVQLREKTIDTGEFIQIAQSTKAICDKYNTPLLINDRIDVALAIDCAGVHVGQSDAPLAVARRLLGPNKVIGVSAGNIDQAIAAQKGGADYLGIGAIYGTQTKDVSNKIMGPAGARAVLAALDPHSPIKTVVIGGIKSDNVLRVLHGVHFRDTKRYLDGVAVVSDIVSSPRPRKATENLARLVQAFRNNENTKPEPAINDIDSVLNKVSEIINAIPDQSPLIQQMANIVTANDQANATLALGASPVMAAVVGDQKDLNPHIGALLINMGTVSDEQKRAMLAGGRYSNINKKPLIFDPVAVGATSFRRETGKELLSHWHPTVIKGNAAEIGALSGLNEVTTKGVDSVGPGFKDPYLVVRSLANRERCVVVMTGKDDYISDGERTAKISNGHQLLGQITGSGCVTGTAIATCCAVASMTEGDMNKDGKLTTGDHFIASIAGIQLAHSKHIPMLTNGISDNYMDLEANGVPTPASLYPPTPLKEKHKLSWTDLGFRTSGKKAKTILSEQNGVVYSGEMMAVLGPSGAGKSTFLDVISKKAKGSSGTVISFDEDSKFNMRDLAQYVEQDDALIGVLTVRETVVFAAKLSLPKSISKAEMLKRVDLTMESLGISEIANMRVGSPIQRGISGGQKRRTNQRLDWIVRHHKK